MKKYNIIYADCPWSYDDKLDYNSAHGGFTYPTLELNDLKSLPVKEIADKNCLLFFWVTMPMLKKGLEVIEAWGFKYTTCAFSWVKTNPKGEGIWHGLGHYTAGNVELCLLGKQGRLKRNRMNVKQVVISPRRKHSQKPDEVRDKIVELLGDLPRIELFARDKVPGWDSLGYDIDGRDIRESIKELL